jgi:2'-5' RNA ligase
MLPSNESALVVLVPEAELLVKPFRDRYDHSAAEGVPAHVTVLYPFKAPSELTAVIPTLHELLARCPAFSFALARAHRFPGVLYLAPLPDEPFKALTRIVVEHFPELLPYRGAFAEIIPHLTVAQVADEGQLDGIALEFGRAARDHLPVPARAAVVALMDNQQGQWQVRARFRLGRPAGE